MDKELNEMLEKLNELLDKVIDMDSMGEKTYKAFKNGLETPAELSIKKDEHGKAEIHSEGSIMSQLVALAGLEKGILTRYKVPAELWELVKTATGTMEAK